MHWQRLWSLHDLCIESGNDEITGLSNYWKFCLRFIRCCSVYVCRYNIDVPGYQALFKRSMQIIFSLLSSFYKITVSRVCLYDITRITIGLDVIKPVLIDVSISIESFALNYFRFDQCVWRYAKSWSSFCMISNELIAWWWVSTTIGHKWTQIWQFGCAQQYANKLFDLTNEMLNQETHIHLIYN